MTLKTRLPHSFQQFFFQFKLNSDIFFAKLRVVTDSTVIIYSVRILVVVLALLMAYIQGPNGKEEVTSVKTSGHIDGRTRTIIDQLK